VREFLGAGSLFGYRLLGESFQEWTIMMLPPGGFFVLAAWLMVIYGWHHLRSKGETEAMQEVVS
jgi:electron transport complex protein RnfE